MAASATNSYTGKGIAESFEDVISLFFLNAIHVDNIALSFGVIQVFYKYKLCAFLELVFRLMSLNP